MRRILWLVGLVLLFTFNVNAEPPTGINLGHDFTIQLVTGDLTSTGLIVTSDVTMTGTANIAVAIQTSSIDIVFGNQSDGTTASKKYLIDLYVEINAEFRAYDSATADVEWKTQARNKDGTWTDLHDYVDMPDVGTTFTASTRKGYVTLSDTIDEIPFDIRVMMKCDTGDVGRGRIKNTSYVRAIFKDITWGL